MFALAAVVTPVEVTDVRGKGLKAVNKDNGQTLQKCEFHFEGK